MNYKRITYMILMLVVFILIGYNIKENFSGHRHVNTDSKGCSPGFYCPKDSRDKIPCPSGSYCPDGKDKVKCKSGSFCPGNVSGLTGFMTPSRSKREQICPDGYFCPDIGLNSATKALPCPVGTVCCYRGESDKQILEGDCLSETEFKELLDQGKTSPGSKGWSARSSYKRCPPGYFCPVDSDNVSRSIIKCRKGYYCPAGSIVEAKCPAGFYCPERLNSLGEKIFGSVKIRCKVEKITKEENIAKKRNCPVREDGFAYCAPTCLEGSFTRKDCEKGFICPEIVDPNDSSKKLHGAVLRRCGDKSINGIPGYLPRYDSNDQTKPISGGKYQKFNGAVSCLECPLGVSSNFTRTSCRGCPAGHYCEKLGSDPKKCPKGKYTPQTYICGEGSNCRAGTQTEILNATAEFPKECFDCEKGTYQNKTGSFQCLPCPIGTFQSSKGSDTCLPCPDGQFQDKTGSDSCKRCRDGYFCSSCLNHTDKTSCELQKCTWNEREQRCYPVKTQSEEVTSYTENEWNNLDIDGSSMSNDDRRQYVQKSRTTDNTRRSQQQTNSDSYNAGNLSPSQANTN